MIPIFKNVVDGSMAKTYQLVSLLSVISKVFEKLVNIRLVNNLEKCGLLIGLELLELLYLIYLKVFERVYYADLHKLKSYGISGQPFSLISSFLSNRRLRVILDGKSSQEYPVNAGVAQRFILEPTLFLLNISDLPSSIICNIASYTDDTTLYS